MTDIWQNAGGKADDKDAKMEFSASGAHWLGRRLEYGNKSLELGDAGLDPMELFGQWFGEAQAAEVPEANGVCLCTVDDEGPDGRVVLLKGFDAQGFSFFTNYGSAKGQQLMATPCAALVFWWQKLRRQVRVRGSVSVLSSQASDDYFATRPRDSQLGAWASVQSQVLENRETLEQRFIAMAKRYPFKVPRPPFWGGFLLSPRSIEFWQGRDSRLHDRFIFRKEGKEALWVEHRLMP